MIIKYCKYRCFRHYIDYCVILAPVWEIPPKWCLIILGDGFSKLSKLRSLRTISGESWVPAIPAGLAYSEAHRAGARASLRFSQHSHAGPWRPGRWAQWFHSPAGHGSATAATAAECKLFDPAASVAATEAWYGMVICSSLNIIHLCSCSICRRMSEYWILSQTRANVYGRFSSDTKFLF